MTLRLSFQIRFRPIGPTIPMVGVSQFDGVEDGAASSGYEIVRRLGVGGMCEVLLARMRGPRGFQRRVVLKRLLPSAEAEPELAASLAAEAMAYARLAHPSIVRLYDFFERDGHATLVLEYVDGVSLSKLRAALRGARLPLDDRASLYIGYRVFEALAAAHGARDPYSGEFAPVIHRDVSPGNVLVPWDGYVKLADFGVAKVSGVSNETRAGVMKGTYGYMAPEQVLGQPVTVRTDVYAGCLLLRELLLGRVTFPRGDVPELEYLRAMAEAKHAPIEQLRDGIAPHVAEALRRGLQLDPDLRDMSAAEMARLLRKSIDVEQSRAVLVALLDRIRPGTRPPATSHDSLAACALTAAHPRAKAVAPTFAPSAPLAQPRLSSYAGVAWSVALVGALAAGGVAARALLRGTEVPRVAAVTAPAAIAPPAATAVIEPAIESAAIDVPASPPSSEPPASSMRAAPATTAQPASTMGDVTTPSSEAGHRVFLDGRAVCGSGATLHVRCGAHAIRIGSAGRLQSIDVPCGGALAVAR